MFRVCARSTELGWGNRRKFHKQAPSTFPPRCYASLCSILPYTIHQSPMRHTIQTRAGNGNHVRERGISGLLIMHGTSLRGPSKTQYSHFDYSVFWVITRREVVWNRRFGTISPFFESSCPRVWPLKMGPIRSPKTLVSNHLTTRNNPEEGRIRFNRGRSLRSCIVQP
jgi:hypothetical protein